MRNLAGETYNHWRVIDYVGVKNKRHYWEIECTGCGNREQLPQRRITDRVVPCEACKPPMVCACGSPDLMPRPGGKFRRQCKPCYLAVQRARTRRYNAKSDTCDGERTPLLPVEPIARWLDPYFREYEGQLKPLAKMLRVDDTILGRIKNRTVKTAKLDTVDRILVSLEAPGVLQELYPEIYQFTDEQLFEAELWAQG